MTPRCNSHRSRSEPFIERAVGVAQRNHADVIVTPLRFGAGSVGVICEWQPLNFGGLNHTDCRPTHTEITFDRARRMPLPDYVIGFLVLGSRVG